MTNKCLLKKKAARYDILSFTVSHCFCTAIATVDGDLFRGSGTSPSSSIRVAIGGFIIRHEVGTSEVFRSTGPSTHLLRLEVYLNSAVQTSITYKYCLPRAEITYL